MFIYIFSIISWNTCETFVLKMEICSLCVTLYVDRHLNADTTFEKYFYTSKKVNLNMNAEKCLKYFHFFLLVNVCLQFALREFREMVSNSFCSYWSICIQTDLSFNYYNLLHKFLVTHRKIFGKKLKKKKGKCI